MLYTALIHIRFTLMRHHYMRVLKFTWFIPASLYSIKFYQLRNSGRSKLGGVETHRVWRQLLKRLLRPSVRPSVRPPVHRPSTVGWIWQCVENRRENRRRSLRVRPMVDGRDTNGLLAASVSFCSDWLRVVWKWRFEWSRWRRGGDLLNASVVQVRSAK